MRGDARIIGEGAADFPALRLLLREPDSTKGD
jgi:hypothetical protein